MTTQFTQDTQQLTQDAVDPRRLGKSNLGIDEEDEADLICILHPNTPKTYNVVKALADSNAQLVLQSPGQQNPQEGELTPLAQVHEHGGDFQAEEPTSTARSDGHGQESLQADETTPAVQSIGPAQDIALRFSSHVIDPSAGFVFGRNSMKCDVNLDPSEDQKRFSNTHFRIYLNYNGVLMLEDMSTNGTIVDRQILGGKKNEPPQPKSMMLSTGSLIEILAPEAVNVLKFVVRIPSRANNAAAYEEKLHEYLNHVHVAAQRANACSIGEGPPITEAAARGMLAAPLKGPPNIKAIPALPAASLSSARVTNWNGAKKYNPVGTLGQGGFATVLKVATYFSGDFFAVKEIDKRRHIYGGVLDRKLQNELDIIRNVKHPNIVEFVEYYETDRHLYIVMEYVPCGDLRGYIESHGRLLEENAQVMSRQSLLALNYLHNERKVTHRDIKPDNILIASERPFVVKLADFGLSKMVTSREMNLTTFCGTMAHCAPEVYPDYAGHSANPTLKRGRHGAPKQRPYTQLVDIWSYGTVVWYALSGRYVFEAKEFNKDKMLDTIMLTLPDPFVLRDVGVSEEAIDLLMNMIQSDPQRRIPTSSCLRHPWIFDGSPDIADAVSNAHASDDGLDELDFIEDRVFGGEQEAHEDYGVGSLNVSDGQENGHSSKRFKVNPPRELLQVADTVRLNSQPGLGGHDYKVPTTPGIQEFHFPKAPKLFGELSQTALRSSGAFNEPQAQPAPYQQQISLQADDGSAQSLTHGSTLSRAHTPNAEHQNDPKNSPQQLLAHRDTTNSNMTAAQNMVQELHTVSPSRLQSLGGERETKKSAQTSIAGKTDASTNPSKDQSAQSKASGPLKESKSNHFNRQIELPYRAADYYDPYDPSTHNAAYASQISGIKFHDESSSITVPGDDGKTIVLPETVAASFQASRPGSQDSRLQPMPRNDMHDSHDNKQYPKSQPARVSQVAHPRFQGATTESRSETGSSSVSYGLLRSTPDSFRSDLEIPLTYEVTTWGREDGCTIPYPDKEDTRIPKKGLEILVHIPKSVHSQSRIHNAHQQVSFNSSSNAKRRPSALQLESARVWIHTMSRRGIFVNGVHMDKANKKGESLCGQLRRGDEVVVYNSSEKGKKEKLAFECVWFAGGSNEVRGDGDEAFVVERERVEKP